MFSSHNILQRSKFSGKTYLIHPSIKIFQVQDKCEENAKPDLNEVWQADNTLLDTKNALFPSLSFAQNEYAVIGDGHGSLYVTHEWKTIFTGSNFCGVGKPFCVLSSLLSQDQKSISALLLYIEDKKNLELSHDIKSTSVVHVVEWVTLRLEDSPALDRVKRFAFHGEIGNLHFNFYTVDFFSLKKYVYTMQNHWSCATKGYCILAKKNLFNYCTIQTAWRR